MENAILEPTVGCDCHIRKAEPTDNLVRIAELLYKGFFVYRFGSSKQKVTKEDAIRSFAKLMGEKYNEFSYNNIWIYVTDSGDIAGVLHGYKVDRIDRSRAVKEINEELKKPLLIFAYNDFWQSAKPDEDRHSAAQMRAVFVDDDYRGHSIGPMLTSEFCRCAKEDWKCNYVYTDIRMEEKVVIEILKKNNFVPTRVVERVILDETAMCIRLQRNLLRETGN